MKFDLEYDLEMSSKWNHLLKITFVFEMAYVDMCHISFLRYSSGDASLFFSTSIVVILPISSIYFDVFNMPPPTNLSDPPCLNSIFRRFMSPAYLNQWIFDWAFDKLTSSPLHNDHLLPPHVFDQLLVVSMSKRFQHTYISTILYNQFEGHLALIPVHSQDNITIGYGINIGSDSKRYADRSSRPPFAPPYAARFFLDHQTTNIVIIKACLEYDILTMHCFDSTSSNQFTFIIPAQEYDWTNLPNRPPVVFEGPVFSPSTEDVNNSFLAFYSDQIESIQLNDMCLTADDVQELLSKLTINANYQNSENNKKFQISVPTSSSSSSSSDTQSITSVLRKRRYIARCALLSDSQNVLFRRSITSIFHNRLSAIGNRVDNSTYIMPGQKSIGQLRNTHYSFSVTDYNFAHSVGPKFAYLYYTAVLSVTPDGPLRVSTNLQEPSFQSDGLTVEQQSEKIKPLPKKNAVQKKDRETILRERRERNRMSARRSNARKQQRVEAMKQEYELSKVLVKQLQEKKRLVQQQNQRLKMLINFTMNR